jgi:DNA-binding transcriptional ArsR family regulator
MATWNFLSNHGQALLYIADCLGITERRTYDIVSDLTEAGYVVKEKEGRRNRYEVQGHLPMPDDLAQEQAIGEVLGVLTGRPGARSRERDSAVRPR